MTQCCFFRAFELVRALTAYIGFVFSLPQPGIEMTAYIDGLPPALSTESLLS